MSTEPLPCGCIPGQHLCEEANRLWTELHRTYHQSKAGQLPREAYQEACRNYSTHYAAIGREQPE